MIPLTHEVKAQLAEQKKQCVFCKIINHEIPGKIVFEDAQTMAILDIYPALRGHTLFMPKEHYPILPYISQDEFEHCFGLVPALTKAIKDGIVCTAFNIFIANGQAAGQQAPHFLLHLFPRDPGDGFFNFFLKLKKEPLPAEKSSALTANMARLMQQYFTQHPQPWHQGKYDLPAYLKLSGTTIYEDEKVLVQIPTETAAVGQVDVYSKVEQHFLEKLSAADSEHFFKVGSFVAALAFELFQAQGTTLLVRSGVTDDHNTGLLTLSVIPRKMDDALQGMLWKPQQPKYNLDTVLGKIKDKAWKVGMKEERTGEISKTPKIATLQAAPVVKAVDWKKEVREAIQKAR